MTIRSFLLATVLLSSIAVRPANAQETADSTAADTEQEELTRSREIVGRLTVIGDTLADLITSQRGTTEDEERELLRMQAIRLVGEIRDLDDELLGLLPRLDSTDAAVDSILGSFRTFVGFLIREYDNSVDTYAARLSTLRERRSRMEPGNLGDLEADINTAQVRLDTVLAGQMAMLATADSVGIDVSRRWDDLDRFLTTRAESQVGRLLIADSERDRLAVQVRDAERAGTSETELALLRTRQRLADQRVAGLVASLRNSSGLLDRRDIETVQYRQAIIEATGEVTSDILNVRVLFGVIGEFVSRGWAGVRAYAPTLFVRLLILIGSVFLFRLLFRVAWRISRKQNRPQLSSLLADLIGRMIAPIGTIVGFLAGLWFIGTNLGALVAGVGVLGIIVGLALQDSMSNLAAGLFILIYRPYERGDLISAGGVVGKVRALGLASTSIVTLDNRLLHVPNRKIWSEVIENRSAEDVRRVEAIAKVSYRDDLEPLFASLRDLLSAHEKILQHPEPFVFVTELGDPWITIKVWGWATTDDWWEVTTELPSLIRAHFQDEGVETPLPRWAWPVGRGAGVETEDD
jgi:small conductance mechanosensitive channel